AMAAPAELAADYALGTGTRRIAAGQVLRASAGAADVGVDAGVEARGRIAQAVAVELEAYSGGAGTRTGDAVGGILLPRFAPPGRRRKGDSDVSQSRREDVGDQGERACERHRSCRRILRRPARGRIQQQARPPGVVL